MSFIQQGQALESERPIKKAQNIIKYESDSAIPSLFATGNKESKVIKCERIFSSNLTLASLPRRGSTTLEIGSSQASKKEDPAATTVPRKKGHIKAVP